MIQLTKNICKPQHATNKCVPIVSITYKESQYLIKILQATHYQVIQ